MKKIGEYTSRGVVPGEPNTRLGLPIKVNLFDGVFTTGYKVTNFQIWGTDYNSDAAADCIGKLSKSRNSTNDGDEFFQANDNNEIAWASSEGAQGSAYDAGLSHSIVDPENMIVEDLWVYARQNGSKDVNYLITMDKYDITEAHGAVTMGQDRSANSGSNWDTT